MKYKIEGKTFESLAEKIKLSVLAEKNLRDATNKKAVQLLVVIPSAGSDAMEAFNLGDIYQPIDENAHQD